jgi:hypothetical protein
LAEVGVILDPVSFFKYAFGTDLKDIAQHIPAVEREVRYLNTRLLKASECQRVCNNEKYDVEGLVYDNIPNCILKQSEPHSFSSEVLEQRIVDATLDGINPEINIDGIDKISLDTGVTTALAEEYSAYKLSAIKAIMAKQGSNNDTLLAAATIQNIVKR